MGCSGYFKKRGVDLPDEIALKGPRWKAVWEKHVAGEIDIQEAYRQHKAISTETELPDMVREKQHQIDEMFAKIKPRARAKLR